MPIAPTLIIGLGGTGSGIIERVKDKIHETSRKQSDRIAFVAFDTDINDLAEIKRRSPEIFTVQTSTRSTVGEYLNINTNARDNWFPVNEMLNRKTLTEGAAQVRAISRLAFDTTLKGGHLEPLHKAIDQLFRIDKDQEDQALRVIITSSLAGGTGSGLILPVAMYLSNYLRTKYPKAKAITRGFFIQPDVFYSVIKATEEQRNLQVNAYAAVRELDAFLMKGDNTLPEQYRDLVFEFPKVAAEGVSVVNAMPYDFCFLFDSNNTAGSGLDSFDSYKDHAATCIYTQSLGPMSKKSNSREDNVLREVIMNDGRNRYAGAGASRLVYPWEHLRDYVAYKWADQALSKQWLKFDEQIKDSREALAKQAENGYASKELDTSVEFVKLVEAAAENKDPFARSIRNQCLVFDEEGITAIGERWNEYVDALIKHVAHQARAAGDDARKRNVANKIANLADSKDPIDYVETYRELDKYHKFVERNVEELSGVIAYSLFKAENHSITKDRHKHQLETYLREAVSNSFIHPVSARYFLYRTLQILKAERQRLNTELTRTTDYFLKFEKSAFTNPENEDESTPEQFANRKQSLRQRMSKKPGSELTEMAEKFNQYLQRIDKLIDQTVKAKVIEEAIMYVKSLTDSFEIFFNALDSQLNSLKSDIDQHRRKYENVNGSTTRYVLASGDSLDYMYKSMPYAGGVITIDSDLSEGIYSKVRQYSMLTDEKDESYFTDLYRNDILGYFQRDVNERHGEQIRFDIIEALEREHRIVSTNYEEAESVHYVVGEIDKAKKLAAPFLEQPLGEERHPIQACAYNPSLEGENDPKRKSLIAEHLGDYGGERDRDLSPQEILFYNAIYGIRASDLSKYAPERLLVTDRRPAGAYFSSYYQLVSGIKPSVAETRVITPHIDRRWHTLAALPDLDDEYQALQLEQIHSAFFAGIVMKVIVWEAGDDSHRRYRYSSLDHSDQEFVVTNGTPCDQFYEVLDALTIDPVAVREVTENVDRKMDIFLEEEPGASFQQSPLAKRISEGITIAELPKVIPGMAGRKYTIFDIPTFYAASAPNGDYSEEMLRVLSGNILKYLISIIEEIQESGESVLEIQRLMKEQFDLYKSNSEVYMDKMGSSFARKIRSVLQPLADEMNNRRLRSLANEVETYVDSLRAL